MINVMDAKRDPIRPSDTGLNVGSDGDGFPRVGAGAGLPRVGGEKFLVDSAEILPSEGQAERDWYEQEAKRQELEAAKSDRQGEEEAQAPQAVKAPRLPGAKEIEEHNLIHCPFRSWCPHCVKGQAKDDAHCVKGHARRSGRIRRRSSVNGLLLFHRRCEQGGH